MSVSRSTPQVGVVLVVCGFWAASVCAQGDTSAQQREEEARRAADAAAGRAEDAAGGLFVARDPENKLPDKEFTRDWRYDYGGWVRSGLTTFDDVGKDRTFRDFDLRLWASSEFAEAHEVYLRGQNQWIHYNQGNSFDGEDRSVFGPRLDQAYYALDLGKYIDRDGFELSVNAGRQFMRFGSGIAYNNVHEGVLVTGLNRFSTKYGVNFQLLASHTLRSQADIDGTKPDGARSRRYFYGAQVGLERFDWAIFANFKPYFYWLNQRDPGREIYRGAKVDTGLDYEYDSYYLGFGGLTELDWELFGWEALKDLFFNGGIVGEFGRADTAVPQVRQARIRAYAFTAEGEYFFRNLPLTPRFTTAYLTASGDGNRGSVTGTVGGNRAGTHDRGFLGFGYVYTGLVFAPRFSNLHVFRGGLSVQPVTGQRWAEMLELGAQGFVFLKASTTGAVSDPAAFKNERFVGFELDFFANWVVASDLTVNLKVGNFTPGAAYANRQDRLYFTGSLTLSF